MLFFPWILAADPWNSPTTLKPRRFCSAPHRVGNLMVLSCDRGAMWGSWKMVAKRLILLGNGVGKLLIIGTITGDISGDILIQGGVPDP